MDKIDQKILAELDASPRMSLTKLARKTLISQQVADYRLRRLIENKKITKFGTIINLKSLGFEQYRIFFTFNSKKEYSNEKLFGYLRNKEGVYWAARIGGKYDLLIVLCVKDFEAFDVFIDVFNTEFPGLIKDYKACYVLEHSFHKHQFINYNKSIVSYGYNDLHASCDSLDFYILRNFKDNCRISALEIAQKRKISYKTIINRIKSMEKNKVILDYRLFLNSEEYKPFILLLSYKDYSKKEEIKLISYLNGKEITQTIRLFGLWNLFVHLRVKGNEELQNFMINLRGNFNIIDNYETIPIFEDISINLLPINIF